MNLRKFLTALFGAALLAATAYLLWLPDVKALKKKNPEQTSYMLIKERQAAARGKKLGRSIAWTGWDGISENLKHAVLVAEDDTFYLHKGVEWNSTWRALKTDLKTMRLARGGSTITQQVARNLYLSPSKNPLRKIKEMLIAGRLERTLGKRRIFEIYLNIAEWGKGIYGAQAAAQAYFGKNAADLTAEEAAALAAVLPSPRRYNPVTGTRFMESRKRQIVGRMRASGYLPEEAEATDLDASLEEVISSTAALPAPADVPLASTGTCGED
ncbi:MAG: monofunctional biosynthetic peptidoglycan transglycosylase [Elusimicrobia bacterium RIFOXYA2_FULL_58_8]|nr:MAG: monofunctional biosynthetic peptidoglycan transglycosylase [Elusimicrobia bacterium RIFOXYA12_FULL_57_11]OGS17188.1 MAG: monofunctional biosynthetic peptidoglycan transglycosylase [Elusimicrobia bacterium RIFOXYA2_FULL_58_8]